MIGASLPLMSCSTVEQAAEMIGVTRQTVFNWLKDPDFLDKLDEARRMALGQAMIVLSAAAGGAVQTLVEIYSDDKQPGSTRTAAANSVLALIDRQMRDEREIREQAERIASLKRALNEAVGPLGKGQQPAIPSTTET
jgi:DNA-binding XRE family transcriptional regulator